MPIQRWNSPVVGRVKGLIIGGLGAAVSIVFFQPWFGITLAAVIGVASIASLLLGAGVTLDTEAGTLGLRWGLIVRRVRLADVTAVLVEDSKLSIGRTTGGEISIYLWGRGGIDRWLGLPVLAGDIGHAVVKAADAARSAAEAAGAEAARAEAAGVSAAGAEAARAEAAGAEAAGAEAAGLAAAGLAAAGADGAGTGRRGYSTASRSALATAALGCLGVLSVCAALLVRHAWHNPVMSVIAVIIALLLGIGGVFYVCLAAALFANSARVSRIRKLAG